MCADLTVHFFFDCLLHPPVPGQHNHFLFVYWFLFVNPQISRDRTFQRSVAAALQPRAMATTFWPTAPGTYNAAGPLYIKLIFLLLALLPSTVVSCSDSVCTQSLSWTLTYMFDAMGALCHMISHNTFPFQRLFLDTNLDFVICFSLNRVTHPSWTQFVSFFFSPSFSV